MWRSLFWWIFIIAVVVVLIRDYICIKLILTCAVYIYFFNLWNYSLFRWFYVLDVTFPRLLISSIFVLQTRFKNYRSFVEQNLLLFSEFLITGLFVTITRCSVYIQSQLCSLSSSHSVKLYSLTLGMCLSFGKRFI